MRIFGDTIQVNAQVATINGFSGHAGQSELVQWYDHMAASKPKLILTHGEDDSRRALAALLKERHGVEASLPNYRETIEV